MHFSTLALTATAALTPIVHAVGNAIVHNNCPQPIYVWSVGSSIGPENTVNPGCEYSEVFRTDPSSGGIAIKITRTENGLYDGSAQTDFAYALDNNGVYYDLSDVFGDPFSGTSVVVTPSDTSCGTIDCGLEEKRLVNIKCTEGSDGDYLSVYENEIGRSGLHM
ncbi:hypothetical protein DTO027B5_2705 [Paecilomyces variotii]|nr:hypothetical protein DTO027B3_2712 [Paecilomyces variotii]KAJ9335563.1 hypothetical protein DTO027B5_2705 [Paecilomyces variotii]